MKQQSDFFIDTLHIFVLFSFAVAQPLFGLLSRNAEFFVAHHSEPVDVIFLILILCALLPVLVVLIEVVVGLFSRRARIGVHGFMVASLVAVIALPALNKILELHGAAILVGPAILGVIATIAYTLYHPVRMFVTVLSPAILIFPGLFLFNSPVSKIVFAEKNSEVIYQEVDATAPIVIIVFDAFSLTSLMDEHRRIDSIRYPHFAALAQDAYWFRNATAVSDYTHLALPAILSGLYPCKPRLPTLADYPRNIFTLLGGSYALKASEPNTKLCPDRLHTINTGAHDDFVDRINSLLLDLSVTYLHIVLPSDLTTRLPAINRNWKNFITNDTAKSNKPKQKNEIQLIQLQEVSWLKHVTGERPRQFLNFIKSIQPSKQPTLYFLHSIIPHEAWRYLPSGKEYTQPAEYKKIRGLLTDEIWGSDEWAVIQAYQRYLLQVGFVDKLLGAIVDHLKGVGLYDSSLIVVTADHGVSFRTNDKRRPITKTNYQDIMCVPLLIKAPNQHEGVVIDRNVQTIDILPTIADILNIPFPWQVDGLSALDQSLPERTEKIFFISTKDKKNMERLVFEAAIDKKYESLQQMLSLFGSGAKADGLFKIGPHNNLVGHAVNEAGVENEADVVIELDRANLYERVDPEGAFVPAQITGRVLKVDTSDPLNLAVAVNGTIRATTRTYPQEGGIHEWLAIVPETSFRAGKNDIEIFIVSLVTGELCLSRTQNQSAVTYFLASGAQECETIITSDGKSIPVISGALHGFLDRAGVSNDRVKFSGWAADVRNSELPEAVVIFVNKKFVYSGMTCTERPDVVKAYGETGLQRSGFAYALLLEDFKGINNPEVRVFAVSKKGEATELHYPEGYKWGRKS